VLLERAIAALTTTFGLISTHPPFSRDLNALISTFFTALIGLTSQTALVPTILYTLHTLIPEHATTFRSNLGRAQQLMLSLIDEGCPSDVQRMAAKVYVDLHHCAPKGTSGDRWRSSLLETISEIHTVLDLIFEVVEEGFPKSYDGNLDRSRLPTTKGLRFKQLEGDYSLCMMARIDRICSLVALVEQFLT